VNVTIKSIPECQSQIGRLDINVDTSYSKPKYARQALRLGKAKLHFYLAEMPGDLVYEI